MFVCVCVCLCACVRECVRACVRACVRGVCTRALTGRLCVWRYSNNDTTIDL